MSQHDDDIRAAVEAAIDEFEAKEAARVERDRILDELVRERKHERNRAPVFKGVKLAVILYMLKRMESMISFLIRKLEEGGDGLFSDEEC